MGRAHYSQLIKGVYISRALTCMKIFLYKQTLFFFIKETGTFGHIVVWTIPASHIDHFTPKHTAFEQAAACLSVFLELLPLTCTVWYRLQYCDTLGELLEKTICMNIPFNYLTTIYEYRSILTQIYVFLVLFTIYIFFFHFDLEKFISKNCKYIFSTRNLYISICCSRIIVVHAHLTVFFLKFTQRVTILQ